MTLQLNFFYYEGTSLATVAKTKLTEHVPFNQSPLAVAMESAINKIPLPTTTKKEAEIENDKPPHTFFY